MTARGRIVLLNGVSSSGKTTLAGLLQGSLAGAWHVLSLDALLAGAPSPRPGAVVGPDEMHVLSQVVRGAQSALVEAAIVMADHGVDVIVDTVLQDGVTDLRAWKTDPGLGLVVVGVHADPAIIEVRERMRPDRREGMAAAQFGVHIGIDYDYWVHTDENFSEEHLVREVSKLIDRFPPERSRP